MTEPPILMTLTRNGTPESRHRGHVAVWQADTGLIGAWGDPSVTIFPRSSCKMVQALPLVESGAADRFGLSARQLALACASHRGAAIHSDAVRAWLRELDLSEAHLRCGSQLPDDPDAHRHLLQPGQRPDQTHNNCSGKHSGFLTLGKHLGAGPEYVEPSHAVQVAVKDAFEAVTEEDSPGFGIDGCSAPNFLCTLTGLARAMAQFAQATRNPAPASRRTSAMQRLTQAMMAHPEMVSGEGGACTDLMRAMQGEAAVKTGAEGVYVAIIPRREIGIALKMEDGAARGAQATVACLLAQLDVLSTQAPVYQALTHGPLTNRRDIVVGHIEPAESLKQWRA